MNRRGIGLAVIAILAAGAVTAAGVGSALVRPFHEGVGPPPPGFRVLSITTPSGHQLRGWTSESPQHRGAVVLMHGVRANRLMMRDRARFLNRAGYDALLFDFQAHGESSGDQITFGWRESEDARAAVAAARAKWPGKPVSAIGVSLGGAAALIGPEPLDVDALVVESVYPTVEQAVRDRVRHYLGPLVVVAAPLLLAQLQPRLGVSASQLRPIDGVARLRCPLFVIGGSRDHQTPASETMEIFARAHEPKELWIVDGAAHVNIQRFAPAEYERRILAFLLLAARSQRKAIVSISVPFDVSPIPALVSVRS